jgi:hypothetical protein
VIDQSHRKLIAQARDSAADLRSERQPFTAELVLSLADALERSQAEAERLRRERGTLCDNLLARERKEYVSYILREAGSADVSNLTTEVLAAHDREQARA